MPRQSVHVDTPEGGSVVVGQYSTDGSWFVMVRLSDDQWVEPSTSRRFTKREALGIQKFLAGQKESVLRELV